MSLSENKFDWSRFTIQTPIPASTKEIYEAWTTCAGIEKWFLSDAKFTTPEGKLREPNEQIQQNDAYEWHWHGYTDAVERGKILATNGKDYLQFTFGEAGVVSVKIIEKEGDKILEITQEEIPHFDTTEVNYHVECATGWKFYLANLKSILQGGLDLRNRNTKLNLE